MTLTVREHVKGASWNALFAQDAEGHHWLALELQERPSPVGTLLREPIAGLLPCPDVPAPLLAQAAREWTAWMLVRSLALELGAGVLLIGRSPETESVARLCERHGCLWVRQWPDGAAAESLPHAPDNVVVFGGRQTDLEKALGICRTSGTVVVAAAGDDKVSLNLYPDVHRRGLRVDFRPLVGSIDSIRGLWATEAPLLVRALRATGW